MDRRQGVDRFHLDDHLTLYEQIEAEADIQSVLAVMDGDGDLPFNGKAGAGQIAGEAMLVNRLQQTRSEFPVHGEGRVHDGAADLVHFR